MSLAPPSIPDLLDTSDTGIDDADDLTNDTTPTLTGTGPLNAIIRIYEGSVLIGETTSDGAGDWSITLPSQAEGSHSYRAVSVDGLGVESPSLYGPLAAVDDAFDVNTFVTGSQDDANLAALADGGFIVTWASDGQDGDSVGVYAQRYDASGAPVDAEFRVNTVTASFQAQPKATGTSDGGFVIVWTSPDADSFGVFAQRYDVAGDAVGGEFRLNAGEASTQYQPNIVALPGGGFLAVWTSTEAGLAGNEIRARMFDADGDPVAAEFEVNTTSDGGQYEPVVTVLSDGGFVITWTADGQVDGLDVFARRFDADGDPVAVEFQVNTTSTSFEDRPKIAALSGGGFVVVWQANGQDGDGLGVFAQQYDANGDPLGGEFQVNTTTTSNQSSPSITALADGGFMVVWASLAGGAETGVFAQRYDATGVPVGTEFQVASDSPAGSTGTAIVGLPDGGVAIAWSAQGQDGDGLGIRARLYEMEPLTLDIEIDTAAPADDGPAQTFIDEGGALDLNGHLSWSDAVDADVTFTLESLTAGSLTLNGIELDVADTFTQAQIDAGELQFIHDGSETTSGGFTFAVTDDAGNEETGSFEVSITPVNGAPTLVGFASSLVVNENGSPTRLDIDGVTLLDDEGNFDGGYLLLSGSLVEDVLSVYDQGMTAGLIGFDSGSGEVFFGGVVIGQASGGGGNPLRVDFNADATTAAIEALVQQLTYANVSDAPTASRDLRLNIVDADGADLGQASMAFTERTGGANPFDGISIGGVGSLATPTFGDLDADGDLDMVLGDSTGVLRFYENIGTATAAAWTERTGLANPFDGIDVGLISLPHLVDLDGDDDLDIVIGENNGTLLAYQNDGGSFSQLTGGSNPFSAVSVGRHGAPTFADFDSDGDLDLFVGELFGTILAYENDGGVFTQLLGADNPFNGVDVGFRAKPAFLDIDKDGDMDAVIGESASALLLYINDGGVFTQATGGDNPFTDFFAFGGQPAPAFADIDGDGDMDAVVGGQNGNLFYLENTSPAGQLITVEVTAENDAPELTDFSVNLTVTEGDGPALLDTDVTFTDAEGNFDGGYLDVLGGEAEDVVSIRNQGMGAGEIGYDSGTGEVFYGGVLIGYATGGCGCAPLAVDFNADATSEAIDALIQNLTFEYQGDDPAATRTLFLSVVDADGAGISGEARGFEPYSGPTAPAIEGIEALFASLADFDGDGDLDLGAVGYDGFTLYRNRGDDEEPDFVAVATYDLPNFSRLPVMIDVDDDGRADLLGVGPGFATYHRTTNAGFRSADHALETMLRRSVATSVDVDGDGDLDLVAASLTPGDFGPVGQLRYIENLGGGDFVERTGLDNPFATIDAGLNIAVGDVDGDGDLDVFTTDLFGIRYYENGAGVFVEQTGFANPLNSLPLPFFALGDLTGDGFADFLAPADIATLFGVNIPIGMQPFQVTVTPVNDDPYVENNLGVALDEGDSVVVDWTELSFLDPDNDLDEVVFTLTGLPSNGVLIRDGTALGLGDTFTQQDIDDGLLNYAHDGSETISDDFTFDVSDGLGGASTGHSFSFDITPVDDEAGALDDAVSTTISAVLNGDVFADNGAGADVDPDGPPLEVVEVNGQAADVGVQILLASGALLTLRADGTFDYDPNGAFGGLTAPWTGGINTLATDSFSYTLAGGATATVMVTIAGEYGGGDFILGGSANDVLLGGYGADTLVGNLGADSMSGGRENDLILGGAGADTLAGELGDDTLQGGTGADQLLGGAGDDYLAGGADNDILQGGTGLDVLLGGEGDDSLHGGSENDSLDGGIGNDQLLGGDGDDAIDGSVGLDTLQGGAGIDLLDGGDGDDNLHGGDGDDSLIGGLGQDLMLGGVGDDRLGGGDDADQLYGGDGADGLLGGAGDDQLFGESGGDVLDGGSGADRLEGGAGLDVLNGQTGNDELLGGEGGDTVNGGSGDDTLWGGDGDDILRGSSGIDTLHGGRGVDHLTGGADNDVLNGEGAADVLEGGLGDDVLTGGCGDDVMSGGAGDDLFVFAGLSGADLVTDFQAGTGSEDVLRLDSAIFTDFADVFAHASNTAAGLLITKDGVSITLAGVKKADLSADDFSFAPAGGPGVGDAPLVLPAGLEGKVEDDAVIVCPPGDPTEALYAWSAGQDGIAGPMRTHEETPWAWLV